MTKAKKIFIGAAALLVIAIVAGLRLYAKRQIKKIPKMTAKECLDYTLEGKEGATVTVGVIKNGAAEWRVYGKDGAEIKKELYSYETGSVTKTITAGIIAELVDDGKLNLDDTIDKYLNLPSNKKYPSLRELLTHTSGYKEHYFESPMIGNFFSSKNSFRGITDNMALNRIAKVNTENADKSWRYSNFGFAALGQIIEAVTGSTYTDKANAFLNELGMARSHVSNGKSENKNYWDWEKEDAYLPAGAMISNIEDMLVYAKLQLSNTGVYAKTHDIMAKVNATSKKYELMDIRVDAMGMAWIIDTKHGFIWHNGATGSYNCYIGFCPKTQTAAVVLSNLPPEYKIPATVTGIKILKEMQ